MASFYGVYILRIRSIVRWNKLIDPVRFINERAEPNIG